MSDKKYWPFSWYLNIYFFKVFNWQSCNLKVFNVYLTDKSLAFDLREENDGKKMDANIQKI